MYKILFLISELPYGGATKQIKWVASILSEENDVHFGVIYEGNHYFKNLSKSVKIYEFNLKKENDLKDNFFKRLKYIMKKTYSYLKKEKFDIVITFGDNSSLILLMYKFLFKYKMVFSERGDPYMNFSKIQHIRRILLLNSDYFVFQSTGASEFYKSKKKIKYSVIPNPVIGNSERSICTIRKSFVFSGRIELKQKRFDLAIKAFEKFSGIKKGYTLFVYGDGPDMDYLKNLIENSKYKNNIKLMGYYENVVEEIKKYEIFLFTSDYEGLPNALIEAMQVGMAVISTDCSPGGARYLISNYKNGIIVPKGDVNKIVEAMEYMVSNKDELDKMKEKAYEINEKLNENKIKNKWLEIIREMR